MVISVFFCLFQGRRLWHRGAGDSSPNPFFFVSKCALLSGPAGQSLWCKMALTVRFRGGTYKNLKRPPSSPWVVTIHFLSLPLLILSSFIFILNPSMILEPILGKERRNLDLRSYQSKSHLCEGIH
jgi:hypothetical protein